MMLRLKPINIITTSVKSTNLLTSSMSTFPSWLKSSAWSAAFSTSDSMSWISLGKAMLTTLFAAIKAPAPIYANEGYYFRCSILGIMKLSRFEKLDCFEGTPRYCFSRSAAAFDETSPRLQIWQTSWRDSGWSTYKAKNSKYYRNNFVCSIWLWVAQSIQNSCKII